MKALARLALFAGTTAALAAAAADIHEGARASVPCQACHGGDGVSLGAETPNLAGQKALYLEMQLKAFKNDERKHSVMNTIAKQLSDADVANLAAYWSSLTPGTAKPELATAAANVRRPIMDFPKDFPGAFTLYYTDESAANKSVTKFYANSLAVQAARAGKQLPDGSVIVTASAGARLDADKNPLRDADGHLIAEAPNGYAAMEVRKGSGQELPELLRNGDWTYALFDAQRARNDANNYTWCFACHKGLAKDDYLFTLKQLAGGAAKG